MMTAYMIAAAAALLQAGPIQILKTPGGLRFGIVGAAVGKPAARHPTVFVYATSLEDSLGREPYNLTCNLLRQSGFLCVSLDLPAHGEDRRPDEPAGLNGWRKRTDAGEPWLAEFKTRASSVLDFLIEKGYTESNQVAAYGTSRGGFSALQWAAADRRILAVAAFSPLTRLEAIDEFAGMSDVRKLDLEASAGELAGTPIWIAIGSNDRRVGIDNAIDFARAVLRAGVVATHAAANRTACRHWRAIAAPHRAHTEAPQ